MSDTRLRAAKTTPFEVSPEPDGRWRVTDNRTGRVVFEAPEREAAEALARYLSDHIREYDA